MDALRAAEFRDAKLNRGFAEYLAVEIQIATLQLIVLLLVLVYLFLTKVIFDASRLASAETRGIHCRVRLEESPKQIIGYLTTLQERKEMLSCGRVGCFDVFNQ